MTRFFCAGSVCASALDMSEGKKGNARSELPAPCKKCLRLDLLYFISASRIYRSLLKVCVFGQGLNHVLNATAAGRRHIIIHFLHLARICGGAFWTPLSEAKIMTYEARIELGTLAEMGAHLDAVIGPSVVIGVQLGLDRGVHWYRLVNILVGVEKRFTQAKPSEGVVVFKREAQWVDVVRMAARA